MPNYLNKKIKLGRLFAYEDPGVLFSLMLFLSLLMLSGIAFIGSRLLLRAENEVVEVPILSQGESQHLLAAEEPQIAPAATAKPQILNITVKSKDSLPKIFARLGLERKDAAALLQLKQAAPLRTLIVGRELNLTVASDSSRVTKVTYPLDALSTLVFTCDNNGWRSHLKRIQPIEKLKYVAARVNSSAYAAAQNVGIPHKLMTQFTNIFRGKANFKKMQPGDRFAIFYREYQVNGKKVKDGDIAAAELVHKGQRHRLIGFKDATGSVDYYTPEGRNTEPPFLRYPVKFDRISSRFSLNRYHPILHVIRPHRGVDLSARPGTPVMAAGNGRVKFVGTKNGYGRAIIIKHGKYTTCYAHLLRFAKRMRQGAYVRRGEVIGYVGASGLATNSHLHYEFHVNGVPHDPLKVKLPSGEMIAPQYRKRFFALAKKMSAQLDLHQRDQRMLALNWEKERDTKKATAVLES